MNVWKQKKEEEEVTKQLEVRTQTVAALELCQAMQTLEKQQKHKLQFDSEMLAVKKPKGKTLSYKAQVKQKAKKQVQKKQLWKKRDFKVLTKRKEEIAKEQDIFSNISDELSQLREENDRICKAENLSNSLELLESRVLKKKKRKFLK